MFKPALASLVLCGLSFYVFYGLTNYLASIRTDVGSVVFAWESSIPFVPWTIYPYWSVNLAYAASFFLAPDQLSLSIHTRRLMLAQCIAFVCFALLPLQFSFGLPEVSGIGESLFSALRAFDRPYNQAPSLHIIIVILMWDWYQRRLQCYRWCLHVWALSVAVSVLTTWQHHFIDIPTGALVATLVIWALPWTPFPGPRVPKQWPDMQHAKLGAYYLVGAVACIVLSFWLGGAWLWLIWPSVSLLCVALMYFGLGTGGFALSGSGERHWAASVLLWPVLLGARINALLWTRRLEKPWSVIAPNLLLGKRPSRAEWGELGEPYIVCLCPEIAPPAKASSVSILDLTFPSPQSLELATKSVQDALDRGERVLLCCALGYSRSVTVATAWMVQYGHAKTVDQAAALIREQHPHGILSPETLSRLKLHLEAR